MSKFVIECPQCGNFAEGRTGFFARKKIDCTCGYTINVRTDKLISRACPHCGNTVVFDQAKGERAKCPVCHETINTLIEQSHYEEFSCEQCGVRLIAGKSTRTEKCSSSRLLTGTSFPKRSITTPINRFSNSSVTISSRPPNMPKVLLA